MRARPPGKDTRAIEHRPETGQPRPLDGFVKRLYGPEAPRAADAMQRDLDQPADTSS
ncbi:MAG: hypothetical protein ACOYJ2_05295 [Rickettsiales bacterium]